MSKALRDKLRRAREFGFEFDGHKFTLLRPTDAELVALEGGDALDYVKRFVVGWDLVELDVIPGGGPDPVAFEAALWGDWVGDHVDYWAPIAKAILDAYTKHQESVGVAEKN